MKVLDQLIKIVEMSNQVQKKSIYLNKHSNELLICPHFHLKTLRISVFVEKNTDDSVIFELSNSEITVVKSEGFTGSIDKAKSLVLELINQEVGV